MDEAIFRQESPAEYFKELVDAALQHQHVEARELTEYYVVNLLCGFVHFDAPSDAAARMDEEPLALRLVDALQSGGSQQRARLRSIGDSSLFISGFFSDSLRRKSSDVDYYAAIGGYAYSSLSRADGETFAPVFTELAEKFSAFVDVLSEVSERSSLTSNRDLLRLYEKWLRTGSRRDGQLLVERGIVPNSTLGSKVVQ